MPCNRLAATQRAEKGTNTHAAVSHLQTRGPDWLGSMPARMMQYRPSYLQEEGEGGGVVDRCRVVVTKDRW